METAKEFESRKELVEYLQHEIDLWDQARLNAKDIEIKHYGYDERIKWDSHIVTLRGWGVFGFTNKEVVK